MNTCEYCEGSGRVYNNGDETSDQYVQCECILERIKIDYPTANDVEMVGDAVFILDKKGGEIGNISIMELESY